MSCAHTGTFDEGNWSEPAPDSADGCADCRAIGDDMRAHLRPA